MCSNLNSVLDSIGLASNVFLLLEWVSNSILSSHAHLPLSTYSIRDYIKKRGADVEQSRKISLRAALARQSWDVLGLSSGFPAHHHLCW